MAIDALELGQEKQPHFVLLPFMAQGHTIPMMDIAKLLAQRGVTVTLILTPKNLARLKAVLARATEELGLDIRVEELNFPAEEAGLPAGCENFDALPSNSLVMNFFVAVHLLQSQLETILMNIQPKPCCLVADMCFTFASEVAGKIGIPRILFHGMCCFALLVLHHLRASKILDSLPDETESFEIPGMPEELKFTRAQVDGMSGHNKKDWFEWQDKFIKDEKAAYGMIMNTFEDMEQTYISKFEKVKEKKVWCVGPVSRCNKEFSDMVGRGNTASFDVNECLKWLDRKEHGSVIYVCLGSLCNLTPNQLLELGLGLEASGRPFVWVIRSGRGNNSSDKLHELMVQNGFEERLKEKGYVIWGWAPQVLLLSHKAVGGFLTHCGWHSSLEGITEGLPMLTWPLFADQFLNEKLLVDVLRIGVRIGIEKIMEFGKEEEVGLLVDRDGVKKAVEKLMDGSDEEGEERRKRAKELAKKAENAGAEGGSSHVSIGQFIDHIRSLKT